LNVNILFERTVSFYQIEPEDLMSKSKISSVSIARAVFCYLSVRRLHTSCVDIANMLNITPSAVSKAVKRGQSIVAESNFDEVLMKC
jgi:chromosomal replication initiation ATPase DnaA